MVNPSFDWESLSGADSQKKNQEFSDYQKIENIEDQSPQKNEPVEFQWGNLQSPETYQGEPDLTADEGYLEYFSRQFVKGASRLGEQALGRFGNMEKFAKDILVSSPKTAGPIGWALSELLGPEKWETMVKGPKGKEQLLPTSQQFKQTSQELTGGYTKAKTPGEEKFDEFVEDVGSTASGRIGTPFQMTANHLLIPAAANVAKQIVKETGFGEDKANLVKGVVWLPLFLATNINAPQYAANLMNQGRNGYGPNLRINVPVYQHNVNQVSRKMLHGDPRSQLAQQQLTGINDDLARGQTSMQDLMTRYDAINAAKRDRGLFALNPGDRRAAIRNINEVRDVVRDEIEALGQVNPQALESWQNGINAFATIHKSTAIRNWVEGVAKGPYAKLLTGPAAALFGVGGIGAFKAPIIAGPLTASTAAAYKSGQTIYRMWNDENLRNYYWEALRAATDENLPAFINNYNKLNKNLEKSESADKENKK